MTITLRFAVLSIIAGTVLFPQVLMAQSVRVYTQKVAAADLCGTTFAKFKCSTTYSNMDLDQHDIAIEIIAGKPNYYQVLGKYYTKLSGNTNDFYNCGPAAANPFAKSDLAQLSSPATFSYAKQSKIEASAELKADVKNALAASGLPADKLKNLEARFATTYRSTAGRKYAINGSYFRVALKDDTVQAIKGAKSDNGAALACHNILKSKPNAGLIRSIAVVKLDSATYSSNLATEITADFVAKVKRDVPDAELAVLEVSMKNSVEKSLKVDLGTEYRVISWDYIDGDSFI